MKKISLIAMVLCGAFSSLALQVFVRTDQGTIAVDVEVDDTIFDIKLKIEEKAFIPCDIQRLVFEAKTLKDHVRVDDAKLEHASTLHLYYKIFPGSERLSKRSKIQVKRKRFPLRLQLRKN